MAEAGAPRGQDAHSTLMTGLIPVMIEATPGAEAGVVTEVAGTATVIDPAAGLLHQRDQGPALLARLAPDLKLPESVLEDDGLKFLFFWDLKMSGYVKMLTHL